MPRNARCVAPGLPYHITQRGTDHQDVFFSIGDRKTYLGLMAENLDEAGVRVPAYCFMTNHVHLVVIPDRADSLSLLMGRVWGRYSQYLNVRRNRCGHLWQARYHYCPMSDRHIWIAMRHVELNPCRACMVTRPEEYRWSSAAAHLLGTGDPSGILDLDFWSRAGGRATWADLHAAPDTPAQVRALKRCTYTGRPFGNEDFVVEMETRFHRAWRRNAADLTSEIAKTV